MLVRVLNPRYALAMAALIALAVAASSCTPSPASGQTATPTPTATPTATPASGQRQPAAETPTPTPTPTGAASRQTVPTATAARGTTDPNNPIRQSSPDVCNPCMVMRITSAAAAGRAAQPIAGEVTARGKEGAIEVLAFHHEVVTPRDTATGQASGRRQHQPIRIVKEVDRATPLIAKALYEGAVLIVTVEFYRTRADGTEERYYTYELKEVIISNISVLGYNPEEVQPAATQRTLVVAHVLERDTRAHFMEEVTFTYKTITQGHVSGVMIEDTVTG